MLCPAHQSVAAASARARTRQPSPPANAPSRERLLKLFGLLEVDKQTEAMKSMMHELMKNQIPSLSRLTPQQLKELDQLENDVTDKVMGPDYMNALREDLIPIYQRSFTAADIDAVIGFYSSPAGQKFLHKQPEIIQEFVPKVMTEAQQRVQKAMEEVHFNERMEKIIAEDDKQD
jgi:hypothetical protein